MIIEIIQEAAAPADLRTCKVCGHTKPSDQFYASGNGTNGRRRTCIRCLRAADRAKSSFHPQKRINARGDVWCPVCERYRLTDHFKRHPGKGREHTWWWCCRDCTKVMDRQRYQAKKRYNPEQWKKDIAERGAAKKRDRDLEQAERIRFVRSSINLLRRRGLLICEIERLAEFGQGRIWGLLQGNHRPDPNTAHRLAILVAATGHLPIGDEPAPRRRKPHPELEQIKSRIAGQLAKYPMRNSWRNGNRPRKEQL